MSGSARGALAQRAARGALTNVRARVLRWARGRPSSLPGQQEAKPHHLSPGLPAAPGAIIAMNDVCHRYRRRFQEDTGIYLLCAFPTTLYGLTESRFTLAGADPVLVRGEVRPLAQLRVQRVRAGLEATSGLGPVCVDATRSVADSYFCSRGPRAPGPRSRRRPRYSRAPSPSRRSRRPPGASATFAQHPAV